MKPIVRYGVYSADTPLDSFCLDDFSEHSAFGSLNEAKRERAIERRSDKKFGNPYKYKIFKAVISLEVTEVK